ncbi:MAG: HtaA domain-containing protein, partial [Solirubrobacterales bacterium]
LSADSLGVAVSLPSGQLTLVLEAAKRIQSSLRSGPISPGTIGGMSAYVTEPFEDPSLEICGIGAATRSFGEVPLAAPSPILVGPTVSPVESAITWGIKSSLNGYVNGFSRPLGLGGATVNPVPGPPNPQIPPRNYTFVATPGQYASNSAETGFDDQAVVNSTGGVMYCNTAHGFRITISNPTVVIDGSASRIIADVDTNLSGNPASGVGDWMPTQRVDLARLDLSGVPAVESGAAVTWSAVPARLTQEGSDALRLCEVNVPGAPPNCLYPAGTVLDPITVAVLIEPS